MVARMRTSLLPAFVLLVLGFTLQAQVHGVPASVSSFGFGGSTSMSPGVPASVTSLGPRGFGNSPRFFNNCCRNTFFPANGRPRVFVSHRRRLHGNFFPGIQVYGVPYYPDVISSDTDEEEGYAAGPTVFDRHGSRSPYVRPREVEQAAPAVASRPVEPEPVVAQPSTVLVFKDGHQAEIQNYAIVSETLFDFSEGRSRKIQLADLDLPATQKANDERGVDFKVPAKAY